MKNKSKSKTKSKSNYPHKKLCGRLHSEAVNSDEEECVSRAKMQMRMQTTQRQHGKKKTHQETCSSDIEMKYMNIESVSFAL